MFQQKEKTFSESVKRLSEIRERKVGKLVPLFKQNFSHLQFMGAATLSITTISITDSQHNVSQHNDSQHYDIWHNDT